MFCPSFSILVQYPPFCPLPLREERELLDSSLFTYYVFFITECVYTLSGSPRGDVGAI